MKVPVRAECVGVQPEPTVRYCVIGDKWGPDGVITSPISPITGLAYASTEADLSYDPTTPWTGADWYKSFGGWIYKAMVNSFRAQKYITSANLIKIVKAILAYSEMTRALMKFEMLYQLNMTYFENHILAEILSSSGGSALYSDRGTLRGKLRLATQERVFLWPFIMWWKNRQNRAYAYQTPWYKYFMIVPWSPLVPGNLARFFDAYIDTQEWKHPETYLREQSLWNVFRDNIIPLLWSKEPYTSYHGYPYDSVLAQSGWRAICYDGQYKEFLQKHFWTHPFSETLGVGQHELPSYAVPDSPVTEKLSTYYWDSDGKGLQLLINGSAFLYPLRTKQNSIVRSPWLDPFEFIYNVYANYESDDDACEEHQGLTITGPMKSDYTFNELTYDECLAFFPDLFNKYNQFETTLPDPDINVHDQLVTKTRGLTAWDVQEYVNNPAKIPVKMPALHWYHDKRRLYKFACAFLNIKPDDTELYRIQRERIESISQGSMSPSTEA
jgi:hypothetical protein